MSRDDMELVHGGGNVFRDFGDPDAEVLQLKAILAGKIMDVLDSKRSACGVLSSSPGTRRLIFRGYVRQASPFHAGSADRHALGKLGQEVEVSVNLRQRRDSSMTSAATR